MKKIILIGVLSILLFTSFGCTSKIRPYKKGGANVEGQWVSPGYKEEGYLDKEIGESQYWVEYFAHGGYISKESLIIQMEENARRRAGELCPNGFTDNFKEMKATESEFEIFRCMILGCIHSPLVGGVVKCEE